jgi:cobalt-zinc-cadmium efflux system outer membrane protein
MALATFALALGTRARAADPPKTDAPLVAVPADEALPATLTLGAAVARFRARGLGLLLADAAKVRAEGDYESAAAVANPNLSFGYGPTFNYSIAPPCSGCTRYAIQWQLDDGGAIVDLLSGKRGLRKEAAKSAVLAAKMARADAERNLVSLVKQQCAQVVLAVATLRAQEAARDGWAKTLKLSRDQFPAVIDAGALARVEVQALEAEQQVTYARASLRQARVGLAFLLGVRGATTDFVTDDALLDAKTPASLAGASEASLRAIAQKRRPDLLAARASERSAAANLALAERSVVPTVVLSVEYSGLAFGQQGASPTFVAPGVAATLPVFYQSQGEIARATAGRDAQALLRAKVEAQLAADVGTAWAAVSGNRELVQRIDEKILPAALTARDVIRDQHAAGGAQLVDLLDAERTLRAARIERATDVAAFWVAVFQLEQAIGEELP